MFKQFISLFLYQHRKDIDSFLKNPLRVQEKVFRSLVKNGLETQFGKEYQFVKNLTQNQFQNNVPIHTYDNLKPYIERILVKKEKNVLWNTPVRWFAMSSGTTSDKSKYIPVTNEALQECHYKCGKQMLALYMENFPNSKFMFGKTLVLGGSQQINSIGKGVYTGDISAVLVENLPFFAQFSRTPSKKTVLMSDWESKIEKLAEESVKKDVRAMAGVPSWLLVLFKYIVEKEGKPIHQIWSNLEVFFHGGVCFTPY